MAYPRAKSIHRGQVFWLYNVLKAAKKVVKLSEKIEGYDGTKVDDAISELSKVIRGGKKSEAKK